MKTTDFIANLINFYYPLSPFVAKVFSDYLISKKFSERDYDKLFKWLTNNFSRKWKVTPTNAEIEEAEKAIREYAYNFGTIDDKLDYGKRSLTGKELIDKYSLPGPEQDYSEKIGETFAQLKAKFKSKQAETNEVK